MVVVARWQAKRLCVLLWDSSNDVLWSHPMVLVLSSKERMCGYGVLTASRYI